MYWSPGAGCVDIVSVCFFAMRFCHPCASIDTVGLQALGITWVVGFVGMRLASQTWSKIMCPVGCSDFSVGFDPSYLVHPQKRTTHLGVNSSS